MKCSIDLYINGNKVDIVNSEQFAAQFALTYSFSDLSEPDKIVDSYSKSITLPGTPNNNRIFGNIWKLDSNNISVFNPSQLSDFQIFLNGELWQSGTVQLQEIARDNNTYTYKVVLYGSITRVMSMLLNSDIDDNNNKLLRSLNFPYKLEHTLSGTMLSQMWQYGSHYTSKFYLNDYMQYVPAQPGLYDNFDCSKKLVKYHSWNNLNLTDTWYYKCVPCIYAEDRLSSTTQITQASSGDEEFDEYPMRQWRVEYQRPAIKMNKLIEQIVSDCSTDASINLDSDFFNNDNPYWNGTYLGLGQYTTDADEGTVTASIDNYTYRYLTNETYVDIDLKFTQQDGVYTIFAPDSSTVVYYGELSGTKTISLEFMLQATAMNYEKVQEWDYESVMINGSYPAASLDLILNDASLNCHTWHVWAQAFSQGYSANSTPYTNGAYDASVHSGIYAHNIHHGAYNDYYIRNYCGYTGINNNYPNNKYQYTIFNYDIKTKWPSYIPIDDANYTWKPFKLDIDLSSLSQEGTITLHIDNIDHNFLGVKIYETDPEHGRPVKYYYAYKNYTLPILLYLKGITIAPAGTSGNGLNNYFPYSYGYTGNGATVSYTKAIRSGGYTGIAATPTRVSTEDMFDTTTTQGDILLNYTKLLGLLYVTDADGNITIMSRNKFFSDYEILDWTDKLDLSRNYTLKPLTFNTRYYEMKYKSGETYYENKYSGEFGLDYGEKKINTGYAFNSEPVQLLDSIFTNTVMANEPRMVYSPAFKKLNIYSASTNDSWVGYVTSERADSFAYPAYFTKDGKKKNKADDVIYNLLFNEGIVNNPGYVTVDSSIMLSSDASTEGGEYCWVNTEAVYSSHNGNVSPTTKESLGIPDGLVYTVSKTPKFTTHYGDYSWEIGYPRISYSGDSENSYPSGSTVYSRFWDSYISEIYNVRNKILTCYVKLSWIDILNFSFKNFVMINGVLYHPNKLLNVNPLSDDPVQVELVQVQNILGYTEGQIIPGGTAVQETTIRRLRRRGLIETEEPEE